MNKYLIVMILVSAAVTFFLRALPFLAFRGNQTMPKWLDDLGLALPPAIMAVLVVYCLKGVRTGINTDSIAQIIATLVVIISYKIKHSTFLSIALGTFVCMLIMRII